MNEQNREIVLYAEDELQLWHERRPGFSIFGSYTGRVVLTSTRLMFLSTGGSGAGRRLLAAGTLGAVGSLLFGQTPTSDLDLSALADEGSLAVPLGRITQGLAQRRCDCTNYVGVQYAKEDGAGSAGSEGGEIAECAFMPKDGIAWPGAATWASKLDEARAAFAKSPYR